MKLLRVLLLVLGVVFLGVLVATNDPAAILAAITGLSWRLAVVAVFPFVLVTTFDTLGWRYAFLRDRVPLVKIGRIPGHGQAEYIEPRYDHPEFQKAFAELNDLLAQQFEGLFGTLL